MWFLTDIICFIMLIIIIRTRLNYITQTCSLIPNDTSIFLSSLIWSNLILDSTLFIHNQNFASFSLFECSFRPTSICSLKLSTSKLHHIVAINSTPPFSSFSCFYFFGRCTKKFNKKRGNVKQN